MQDTVCKVMTIVGIMDMVLVSEEDAPCENLLALYVHDEQAVTVVAFFHQTQDYAKLI